MKRVQLHIVFWLLYVIQDSLLIYTWLGPSLKMPGDKDTLIASFLDVIIMLIPKLLICYFILYVSIRNFLKEEINIYKTGFEILAVFIASIVIYRLLLIYMINPYIFRSALKVGTLFDVRGVLMAFMDIGCVAGLAAFIKFVRIQLINNEREKDLVKQKLESELKFLRNQTSPHFLMNTLNNIYALARKKSDDTPEIVLKLSELLRFMLYESGGKRISLKDEIKVLEDYIELEKMRYNNRLTVKFEKEIDSGAYQITPLLLLPFVENAFKHGVNKTRFETYIHIHLKVKDGNLDFIIENSKDAGEQNIIQNQIGLTNVRRQLELMYRSHSLDVQDHSTSFKVNLKVKLESYAEI